jgi:hypothetical protein
MRVCVCEKERERERDIEVISRLADGRIRKKESYFLQRRRKRWRERREKKVTGKREKLRSAKCLRVWKKSHLSLEASSEKMFEHSFADFISTINVTSETDFRQAILDMIKYRREKMNQLESSSGKSLFLLFINY